MLQEFLENVNFHIFYDRSQRSTTRCTDLCLPVTNLKGCRVRMRRTRSRMMTGQKIVTAMQLSAPAPTFLIVQILLAVLLMSHSPFLLMTKINIIVLPHFKHFGGTSHKYNFLEYSIPMSSSSAIPLMIILMIPQALDFALQKRP